MNKNIVITVIIASLILIIVIYKAFIEVPGYVAGERAIEELTQKAYYQETEEFLKKIYIKDGNVEEALPEFEGFNNAPEDWIWNVLHRNLEEGKQYTYRQIEKKLQELFSNQISFSFPEEGIKDLIVKGEDGLYTKIDRPKSEYKNLYMTRSLSQEGNNYTINILEYKIKDEIENNKIILFNNKGEIKKEYSYETKEEREQIKKDMEKDIIDLLSYQRQKEIKIVMQENATPIVVSIRKK